MTTELTLKATEEGTYVMNIVFRDEDDVNISPNSANWSLTDLKGNPVNSRTEVNISPIAAVVDVVLSALDLELNPAYAGSERWFIVEYVYDSTLGNDLPAKTQAKFDIEGLVKVT